MHRRPSSCPSLAAPGTMDAEIMRISFSRWASASALVFLYASIGCTEQAVAAPPRAPRARVVSAKAGPTAAPSLSAAKVAPAPLPPTIPPERLRAAAFAKWLEEKLPPGGRLVPGEPGEPPAIVHTAQPGESLAKVAAAYLDLSDVYLLYDFAAATGKANPKSRYSLKPAAELP